MWGNQGTFLFGVDRQDIRARQHGLAGAAIRVARLCQGNILALRSTENH